MSWRGWWPVSSTFPMSSKETGDPAAVSGQVLEGLAASRGVVAGPAFLFRTSGTEQIPEYRLEPEQVPQEVKRLSDAFALTRVQLLSLATELGKRLSGDEAMIFEGHLMMLEDPSFQNACKEKITRDQANAERAVDRASQTFIGIFEAMDDAYLRERAKDVSDIARRVIRNLLGGEPVGVRLDQPCIVVADDLTPSETISMPKHLILGFATERGSATSHASVLARALGIPAVVGLGQVASRVKTGDLLLLDGTRGVVVVNPGRDERQAFDKLMVRSREVEVSLELGREGPGLTSDGHPVPLLANVDNSTPMTEVLAVGAEGIGLYRTEYQWMSLGREPTEEEQASAYTEAARSVPQGQAVTIRVLDLGGDKVAKGVAGGHREANPFLGNRSIRCLLSHPEVFRRQLRAILRASAHGRVRVMYPMVTALEELRAANLELAEAMESLRREGVAFDASLRRGVMIEVPGAALIAQSLVMEADFLSIGTNDLIQYTLAVDRINETVARLYQPTHPGVLSLIEMTVAAGNACGKPVAVCGEMAADPVMAILLVGMGVDEFSMSPNLIPLVKRVLSLISLADAQQVAAAVRAMRGISAEAVYGECRRLVLERVPELASLQ